MQNWEIEQSCFVYLAVNCQEFIVLTQYPTWNESCK